MAGRIKKCGLSYTQRKHKVTGKGKPVLIKSKKKPIRNSDPEVYLDKLEKKLDTNTCRTQTEKENKSGSSTEKDN